MEIRSLVASAQGPQGLEALGATAAAASTQQPSEPSWFATLEPPVKLDLATTNTGKARYIQDPVPARSSSRWWILHPET